MSYQNTWAADSRSDYSCAQFQVCHLHFHFVDPSVNMQQIMV